MLLNKPLPLVIHTANELDRLQLKLTGEKASCDRCKSHSSVKPYRKLHGYMPRFDSTVGRNES